MARKKPGKDRGWLVALMFVIGAAWGWHEIKDKWNQFFGSSDPGVHLTINGDDEADTDDAESAASSSPSPDRWPPLEDSSVATAPDLTASNYYIVLDGSGSMRNSRCSGDASKIDVALSALQRFVATVPAGANLGLAVFDSHGLGERVPLGTDNRTAFDSALSAIKARGGTPLRSSIQLAYDQLTIQAQRQLGYGEYHLVVVTDGRPDPEEEDPTDVVDRIIDQSPVVVHTIGFCLGEDHVLNQPGRTLYMAADSPEQLDQGLASVLAEAPSFDAANFEQQ
jgi:uncharacterized protein YegL